MFSEQYIQALHQMFPIAWLATVVLWCVTYIAKKEYELHKKMEDFKKKTGRK